MKKLVSLLLALVICLSLAACGGPDKQPAIDAHNNAATAINALTELINADPAAYADYVDFEEMESLIELLNQCGEYLENGKDLEQEDLDEWVEVCQEVEQWALDVRAEVGR